MRGEVRWLLGYLALGDGGSEQVVAAVCIVMGVVSSRLMMVIE